MTFAHYLQQLGRDSSLLSQEEWKVLYAAYRSDYKKQYQADFRKRFKRVEVLFTAAEYRLLEKASTRYGVKPNRLVKSFYLAYQDSQVTLPPFQKLEEASVLLRRSSNNINQIVHSAHILKTVDNQKFTALVTQIEDMKQVVNKLYLTPKIIFSPLTLSDDY